jgi:catechol 2,3-dioxygenase-like lactoylglutathione lyase family enzyme
MNVRGVDFLFCTVSDLDKSVRFYRDTLGLDLEWHDAELGWAEFAAPPTTLSLGEESPQVPTTPGSGGGLALAVDDVEAALEELVTADVEVLMDPVDTSVCDMAMVADPDGNPVILHHRHDGTHGRRDPFP